MFKPRGFQNNVVLRQVLPMRLYTGSLNNAEKLFLFRQFKKTNGSNSRQFLCSPVTVPFYCNREMMETLTKPKTQSTKIPEKKEKGNKEKQR